MDTVVLQAYTVVLQVDTVVLPVDTVVLRVHIVVLRILTERVYSPLSGMLQQLNTPGKDYTAHKVYFIFYDSLYVTCCTMYT